MARGVIRLAAALALLAGAALAEPAMVFAGADWRQEIAPADVFAFQAFTPPGGRLALAVTLKPEAAGTLARNTGIATGEVVTVTDREGEVLLSGPLAQPIDRGMFAITFDNPEAARRMARRLLAQE